MNRETKATLITVAIFAIVAMLIFFPRQIETGLFYIILMLAPIGIVGGLILAFRWLWMKIYERLD